MKDTWYVCDPDWEDALGPMSRPQLDRLIAQRKLSASCLAWHPDLSEWRPLYGTLGASTSDSRSSSAETAAAAANAAQATPKSAEQVAQSSKAQRKAQQQAQQDAKANNRANESARQNAQRQRDAQAAKAARSKPSAPAAVAAAAPDKSKEQEANAAFFVQSMRRLGARIIDLLLVMPILLGAAFAFVQQQFGLWPGRGAYELDPSGLIWIGLVLAVPVEALMLALFGTTPGKWLFGLGVQNRQGDKPSLAAAFGRQQNVFVRGLALGIPVLSLIALMVAGVQTLSDKAAPWDKTRGLRLVDTSEPGSIRAKLAIAGVVAALYFFAEDSILDVIHHFQQSFGMSMPVEAG